MFAHSHLVVRSFVVGGAIIDELGDTLAVVEMSDGGGCPTAFVAKYTIDGNLPQALLSGNGRTVDQGGPDVPSPTGKWSNRSLGDAVA